MSSTNCKEAVPAVIGVILMVAITVAIVATVYVYVAGVVSEDYGEIYLDVAGNTTMITMQLNYGDVDYVVTFDYNHTYRIEDDDFDWELGKFYNMTLYTDKYIADWIIYRYSETEFIK